MHMASHVYSQNMYVMHSCTQPAIYTCHRAADVKLYSAKD